MIGKLPILLMLPFFLVTFSGCLSDSTPSDDAALDPPVYELGATELAPETRPGVDSVVWLEDPGESIMDNPWVQGAESWEPREVELTYHGIQPVFDVWQRPVPAHVFRYRPMELVVTDVQINGGELELQGKYEETLIEYAFDARDGNFMGRLNLDREVRGFYDPENRHPITWRYTRPLLLFMAVHLLDGDPTSGTIPIHHWYGQFQEESGEPPLPAKGCTVYRFTLVDPDAPPLDPDAADLSRTLICLESGKLMPKWAWSGTPDDAISFQRLGPSFEIAPLVGEPEPPHQFPTEPWHVLNPLPGITATHLPPSGADGDWASQLHDRMAALYLNPSFLLYTQKHESLYLNDAITGWPSITRFPLLPIEPPTLGVTWDEQSWMMVTEGQGYYWGFVDTYRQQDGDDRHISTSSGSDGDGFLDRSYYTLDELPTEIPPIGHVVHTYNVVAPPAAKLIDWMVWPKFDDDDIDARTIMWSGLETCFEEPDPTQPERFVMISGLTGQLIAAGRVQTRDNGCSWGSGFLVPGPEGELLQYYPETEFGVPFLLPENGPPIRL